MTTRLVTTLHDVVNRGTGTATRRLVVTGAIGGKTGSTNGDHDAWFVQFSSSVVGGVCVGFDQPERIHPSGSGARVALPIWFDFMRRTTRRLPPCPVYEGNLKQRAQRALRDILGAIGRGIRGLSAGSEPAEAVNAGSALNRRPLLPDTCRRTKRQGNSLATPTGFSRLR